MKYGAIKMIDAQLNEMSEVTQEDALLELRELAILNTDPNASSDSMADAARLAALAVKVLYFAMNTDIGQYPGNAL